MAATCNHTIHQSHLGWNNANTPVLSIAPVRLNRFRAKNGTGLLNLPAPSPSLVLLS